MRLRRPARRHRHGQPHRLHRRQNGGPNGRPYRAWRGEWLKGVFGLSDDNSPSDIPDSAKDTDAKVLQKFGAYIPESKKSPAASEVAVYQSDTDFQNGFKERYPNYKQQGYNLESIHGESYHSQIFINKDKDTGGTFTHEAVHHYSDDSFKSQFYNIQGVKLNEGVTELYTRELNPENREGHYTSELAWAKKVETEVGEDQLKKAYFGGDKTAMAEVERAMNKLNSEESE